MRRSFETLRQSSTRGAVLVPMIAAAIWWAGRTALNMAGVNGYTTTSSYRVAFAAAALTLFLTASSVTPAWSWSSGRQLGQILAPVAVVALVSALLEAFLSTSPLVWPATVGASLGAVHLGLLATLAVRLGSRPGGSTALFVLLALALPALLPDLRPLVDAEPSFHSATFPRSSAALAPILTLAVIVLALPPRSIAAPPRGDLE